MLLSVALNPVLDNNIFVQEFFPGKDINPIKSSFRPGGKAMNTARIWKKLGEDAHIIGFIAGIPGNLIKQAITASEIAYCLVEAQGSSRICTNIIESNGCYTSIHQIGDFSITKAAQSDFLAILQQVLTTSSYCVIAGSIPPSLPEGFYATLVKLCHSVGVPCLMDTSGPTLHAILSALPTVVKINQIEAAEFVGNEVSSESEAYETCKALAQSGAETAIVTLAELGAVVYERKTDRAWHLYPPKVSIASSIGCGDAFSAGLSVASRRKFDTPDRYAFAVGIATAVAMQDEPDSLRVEDAYRLAREVIVRSL